MPTIIIFKNGEEVKRYVGLTSKERLITDLKEIIKKAQ
ncbi:MAG: thioredoxin [Bacteroidales bacterium]|nr:thioredoxin [Bacteroidales bacterium]